LAFLARIFCHGSEMNDDGAPRRRVMDKSNSQVRLALAQSIAQIGEWRSETALLSAQAARSDGRASERLLARVSEIQAGIMAIRMDLLAGLADAPPAIKGHGRVVDVEKALDNLEAMLREVRRG
jgi:hypothetical protein